MSAAIPYTVWSSVADLKSFEDRKASWPELISLIEQPETFPSKRACPLIKLATFGKRPNAKGSLRTDENVDMVYGIEGDYDANVVTPAEGAERLRAAGVKALIYTSSTHLVVDPKRNPHGGPRWRVLAPLSGPVGPAMRHELTSLLNGALGGILGAESWVLSQTYYFGKVKGVTYESRVVDGECLDLHALCPAFDPVDPPRAARAAAKLAAPRRKQDADGAEIAHLDTAGWLTGGERSDGAVNVRCPRHELHGTDSGPTSATYFPAGVGGRSEGGFECRHSSCGKPSTTEFWAATGLDKLVKERVVAEFEPVLSEVQPLPAFERDKKNGRAEATRNNLDTALLHPSVSGWRLRFDRFLGRVMLAPDSTEEWRALDDNDYTRIARHLESGELRFKHIPVELIRAAIDDVAERHSFDSAQVWLATQEWDGVERCETFLTDYLGVEDTPYARSVSLYIWTALAGRVIEPGIKADMVPVLVGDQGVGKSTTIAALSPDPGFFGELNLALKDAELVRSMRGKLVLELGELRGMRVKEIDDLKQFIACRRDEFRDLYKRHMTVYPRRSLFIGSTNNETFLVDDTGARRWLPVTVPTRTQGEVASQVKAVARDCGQLWAEGARVFAQGGIQWQDAENLAKHEHGKFTHVDVWFEIIERWLAEPEFDGGAPRGAAGVTANELLLSALDVAKGAITDAARRRVTAVLRQLGYSEGRLRTADGKRPRVFRKT